MNPNRALIALQPNCLPFLHILNKQTTTTCPTFHLHQTELLTPSKTNQSMRLIPTQPPSDSAPPSRETEWSERWTRTYFTYNNSMKSVDLKWLTVSIYSSVHTRSTSRRMTRPRNWMRIRTLHGTKTRIITRSLCLCLVRVKISLHIFTVCVSSLSLFILSTHSETRIPLIVFNKNLHANNYRLNPH